MLFLLKKILKTERIAIDVIFIYIYKKIIHSYLFRLFQSQESKILFIVGCQRSGTSLMNRIFTRDLRVSVYREASKLSSKDAAEKIRLNPLNEVRQIISKNKALLIVAKPLVESQNVLELLKNFPNSKALWMYRNYRDVAKSNPQRFGANQGILDLKPIVQSDRENWRGEKVSDYVRSIVTQHFSEDMNVHDAAALFWFARNQLFYELNLEQNAQVFICRYEELVAKPLKMMKNIYKFLNMDFEETEKINEVHSKAIGGGNTVDLSPPIEQLCNELQQKLDRTYFSQVEKNDSELMMSNVN